MLKISSAHVPIFAVLSCGPHPHPQPTLSRTQRGLDSALSHNVLQQRMKSWSMAWAESIRLVSFVTGSSKFHVRRDPVQYDEYLCLQNENTPKKNT